MTFSWTYEKGEAKCEKRGYAMFARQGGAFIMRGGTEIASTPEPATLLEAVLWCENQVMRREWDRCMR